MAQYALPDADKGSATWFEGIGDGDSNWYDELDEGFGPGRGSGSGPDSSTFWITVLHPINKSITTALSAVDDPLTDSGHVYRTRNAKNASGGEQIDITIELLESGSIIATKVFTNVGGSFGTRSDSLSTAEADSIGNYGNLEIRTTANALGGGDTRWAAESAHEFECPDTPPPVHGISATIAAVALAIAPVSQPLQRIRSTIPIASGVPAKVTVPLSMITATIPITSAASVPKLTVFIIPVIDEALELLVKLHLDAGIRRVAFIGIATGSYFYEPELAGLEDITREISLQPVDFRAAQLVVRLDDSQGAWSKILNEEPVTGRLLEVLAFDPALGESDAITIAAGVVANWSADAGTITLTAEDTSLRRLDQVLDGRIDNVKFPDVPDKTPRALVPLVIGLVSSEGSGQSNTGAIPCYLIDPNVTSPKWQYVACQGEVGSIVNVYLYGEKVTSGFTVQTRTFDGKPYTTIEFDTDQRESSRPNESEITCDVDGRTDDGTSSGNRIENPARMWEEVLLQNGFAAGDLDADSFTSAANTYGGRSVTGGFASVNNAETLRTIAENFAKSFNLTTYASREGLLAVTAPEPGADITPEIVTIDESQIVRDSLTWFGVDTKASSIVYKYARNWVTKQYDLEGLLHDSVLQDRLNRDIRVIREQPYVRDVSSASTVANDGLFFLSDKRVGVRVGVDAALLRSLKVGATISLKHFALTAFDKSTYRVLGAGPSFDGAAMFTALSLVDIVAGVLTGGSEFLALVEDKGFLSDYYHEGVQGTGTGMGLR